MLEKRTCYWVLWHGGECERKMGNSGREQLALDVDLDGTSSVWFDKWLKSDEMDEMKVEAEVEQ
jgi:hypothetical protein